MKLDTRQDKGPKIGATNFKYKILIEMMIDDERFDKSQSM